MSVMTPPGLAIDSVKIALVFGLMARSNDAMIVGIRPDDVPAEILERVIELVDRAAVELLRRDEFVAGLHQAMEHQNLRRVAGRHGKSRRAAFERGDALLEHGLGRIADARIDVAEGLQAEQRSGVIDAFEHIRGGLIDRRRARAGGRIGLRAGMDGKRGEARNAFGHRARSSSLRKLQSRFIGPAEAVKARRVHCVN